MIHSGLKVQNHHFKCTPVYLFFEKCSSWNVIQKPRSGLARTMQTGSLNKILLPFLLLLVSQESPEILTLMWTLVQFSSATQLYLTLGNHHGLQHAQPSCPSPISRAYSNSCLSHLWCYPTISSLVVPFSSHIQSFPESGSFPMSQLFTSGGQNAGVSASALVLPMNTQDWFSLGWTGWISLQSKGLSRVFSNTVVQKL